MAGLESIMDGLNAQKKEKTIYYSPRKSPKQKNSLVKKVNSTTVNEGLCPLTMSSSNVFESLHIDTELVNKKSKASSSRRCSSESKVSSYIKNITPTLSRKRKLDFMESLSNSKKKRKNRLCCKIENVGEQIDNNKSELKPWLSDSFAELSAEEYKFRHHIGERNAVEKVISYSETVSLNKLYKNEQQMEFNEPAVTKEENNNTLKMTELQQKALKNVYIDTDISFRATALKQEVLDEKPVNFKETEEQFDDNDDVFTKLKDKPSLELETEELLKKASVSKKKKGKAEYMSFPEPETRKRRIASLTAQTKMQILYEKDEVRVPRKKVRLNSAPLKDSKNKGQTNTKTGTVKETTKKVEKPEKMLKKKCKTKDMMSKSDLNLLSKTKKSRKVIMKSNLVSEAIHVARSVAGLQTPPAIWQQPVNVTVNKMYIDSQTQFIPLQSASGISALQLSQTVTSKEKKTAELSEEKKAKLTARKKWKKKLQNPSHGVRNSCRTASLHAQAVMTSYNQGHKVRSGSNKPEFRAKKKKYLSAEKGQWIVGLGPTYNFIPNTGNAVFLSNTATLPSYATAAFPISAAKKKKKKKHTPLEGLGQQLLASAAGTNVILPSSLEGQTVTIGGIGSLSTPIMPVQFTPSSTSSGKNHFSQAFSTGSVLPQSVPETFITKQYKTLQKKKKPKNNFLKVKQRLKTTVPPPSLKPKIRKKSTNGWQGIGEQFQKSVFLQNDAPSVVRNCYSAMKRKGGDIINVLDCILLKSGPRKIDLPYIAKVAAIWDDPEEGELMVSILWYYRPEHIEGGRKPHHHEVELFASKHKDHNSVATIEDRCYVLTLAEYNRHCRVVKMTAEGIKNGIPLVPLAEEYPRKDRLPSEYIDKELTYFCRHVYDYKLKRILKNPS
ncbi:LOW QUALITY PROTEIN: uncharacterized protein LOC102801554 [Saccoglossus kowalevskii]